MTLWFHPVCAAYKRPQALLEALGQTPESVPGRDGMERAARRGMTLPRLVRIDGAERAPGGQALCRSCRQQIARGSWRIRLVFYEEGRFSPGGFVHLECRETYFGTDDVLEPLLYFSAALTNVEQEELRRACAASP
jgi:hypothetical protein